MKFTWYYGGEGRGWGAEKGSGRWKLKQKAVAPSDVKPCELLG